MNSSLTPPGTDRGRRAGLGALLLACLLVLAACVGGTGAAGGSSAGGSSPEPQGLGQYYSQQIDWSSCGGGFECGQVTVPLDYDSPQGKSVELSVIRLPAGNPDQRVGSLVTNPGGPGASGLRYVRQARRLIPAKIRDRFDIVGFDPRGVGKSAPIECASAGQLDRYLSLDASPNSQQERQALVQASRKFADRCGKQEGKALPHVGTVDAARDMDILRAALGDDKLTYLGISYGTLLGAVYADRFPNKVRALVLDGAVDPTVPPLKASIVQAQGFEKALRSFVSDCVGRSACPLGTEGVSAGLDRLEKFFARTDKNPLPVRGSGQRELTQSLAKTGVAAALYNKDYWPILRKALQSGFNGDGGPLLRLADSLNGRKPDGTYNNLVESNLAISCVDQPAPEQVRAYAQAAERGDKKAPHFGEFVVWGGLPCAFWPVPANEKPKVDAAGAPPIVVTGTTRDPATPYRWAEALANQLESGRLLTRKGDGHTAYNVGNQCVDRAINQYLIEGEPPKPGKTC